MSTKLATFTEHRTRILRPFLFLAHMKGGNDMTTLTPKSGSMFRLARRAALVTAVALAALVAPSTPVAATSEVFLSNDVALSEVTSVIQFDTTVTGKIGKIRVLLPSGSNAGNARLGRLSIGDVALEVGRGDATLTADPSNASAVIAEITIPRPVPAASRIRVELFHLSNPTPGNHAVEARTFDEAGALLEVAPPISLTVYDSGAGDITAVTAGTGLTGGGTSGDVTLNVDTAQIQKRVTGSCPAGSSIRAIDVSGTVLCQTDADSGGTVVSVDTGSGLTGGPITSSGTISIPVGGVTSAHILDGTIGSIDVDPAQIQLRVTGSCPSDQAIGAVNADGTVGCQSVASGVTQVTASAPLVSSGGAAPDISLPHVIINSNNAAIGLLALSSNTTGFANTAAGTRTLANNTTGIGNTATGHFALFHNTTGGSNTATGTNALFNNTGGGGNTAAGVDALASTTTGNDNTAVGVGALTTNETGARNTAIGALANVSSVNLNNATAIGFGTIVNASNKIRLGNAEVTVIEGQVGFTASSDRTKKENFQPVDGEAVLKKLQGFTLTSWNFIGHDPRQFRHYGPMAQDFFAAFGHDAIGTIGTPTTITSTDMAGILMIAAQALEKRSLRQREEIDTLRAANGELKARVEALEHLLGNRTYASVSGEPCR
jgi:endosialidase-like protein